VDRAVSDSPASFRFGGDPNHKLFRFLWGNDLGMLQFIFISILNLRIEELREFY
jgi:hypothetical protein